MKEEHCQNPSINPKPGKFSLEDKYQKYRVEYKKATTFK